jgi:CheY-like chemotaxis protein
VSDSTKEMFAYELGKALTHLYDPGTLRHSLLVPIFALDQRADAPTALQQSLTQAIAALKPDPSVPPRSNAWRLYHILFYRYTEQFTQREVATDLAISIRQLRRQESVAVAVLADYLWAQYDLGPVVRSLAPSLPSGPASPEDEDAPSLEDELEWLERTAPSRPVSLPDLLESVLETARPLMAESDMTVTADMPGGLALLAVQVTAARQALLHLVTLAMRVAPGGRIAVSASPVTGQARACIEVNVERGRPLDLLPVITDQELALAGRLAQVAGGALSLTLSPSTNVAFVASMVLPLAEQLPVFVVDDNADTRALIERYLAGSRYRFMGVADPQQVLRLAEETPPVVVVLDVMLPEVDGWELLGRLRAHPLTHAVPIIITTILPQEQLARSLGAAEFIAKPVSRAALLAALDRWTASPTPESR